MSSGQSRHIKDRLKRMLPAFIYALLLVGSAVMVSFWGGTIPYVLFFLFLIYLPAAAIYLAVCRVLVTSHQEIDTVYLRKQQKGRYSLILENTGPIPIPALRLLVPPNAFSFDDEFIEKDYSLMPRQRMEIHTHIICKYAGSYGVGIYKLMLMDPFGLIKMTFDISQGTILVSVKPDITEVAYEGLGRILSVADSRTRKFTQDRQADTTGNDMRKYMPGDPLSKIHWKSYARTGKLLVRLPENSELTMPVIVLESSDFEVDEEHLKIRDAFIEYAVSAADFFAKQKKPVRVVFYKFAVAEHIIDGYENFNNFYIDVTRHLPSKGVEEEKSMLYSAAGNSGSLILCLKEEKELVLRSMM